ncbi:carbohydrate ABC transporter permease [Natronospora cellulosivora (SeqCode)]
MNFKTLKSKIQIRNRRISRSTGGDLFILILLGLGAAFTALPLLLVIMNAFKPLDELFYFPPRFFVRNPTLGNFQDLVILMGQSWIPISRYLLNSLIIVTGGLLGNLFFGSMAAYSLSIFKFPGKKFLNEMIMLSLMFAAQVSAIANYVTISALGWVDTYWAIIVPAWAATLGVFIMKKFMDSMVSESLIEAARIDGASEFRIYWNIVMPIVKPAWLTLMILTFQQLWGQTGQRFLYAEELKTLPYALQQIQAGGVARRGVGAAVMLLMMIIPIIVFVINQSKIVQTMGTSGLD